MTESQVVRQILDYLAAERIFAFRLNSAAFAREHKGKRRFFRAHSLGLGASDILAIVNVGVMCFMPTWIECKTERGQQSPEQKSFQEFVESLGHRYILARSWEDVKNALQL